MKPEMEVVYFPQFVEKLGIPALAFERHEFHCSADGDVIGITKGSAVKSGGKIILVAARLHDAHNKPVHDHHGEAVWVCELEGAQPGKKYRVFAHDATGGTFHNPAW